MQFGHDKLECLSTATVSKRVRAVERSLQICSFGLFHDKIVQTWREMQWMSLTSEDLTGLNLYVGDDCNMYGGCTRARFISALFCSGICRTTDLFAALALHFVILGQSSSEVTRNLVMTECRVQVRNSQKRRGEGL